MFNLQYHLGENFLASHNYNPELLMTIAGMDHRAGRIVDAQRGYRAVLELRPDDAKALHLLGLTEAELGRLDAGIGLMRRAAALKPSDANIHVSLAHLFHRAANLEEAVLACSRAVKAAPQRADLFELLVQTTGKLTEQAARMGTLIAEPPKTTPSDSEPQSVSIIVCSIDDEKARRIRAHYEALFAGRTMEILQIGDAKSLCEAYNRGVAQTSGDVLIFSHDDIEIVSDDFAGRLMRHMMSNDIVGVAGTSRLAGPAWIMAGWPHVHGCIAHQLGDRNNLTFECYGPASGAIAIQAVDGVFFAVRRSVFDKVTFDAGMFDGFHLYDIDFSFTAFTAGFRIAVPWDILLVHQSGGQYDANWQRYSEKFVKKHRTHFSTMGQGSTAKWCSVGLKTKAEIVDLHRRLLDTKTQD